MKSIGIIPHKIYYFWQHNRPLTELGQKCLNSWKKYFPDFEIVQIDESNFDVLQCDFSKVSWEAKRYQYVSDYARLKVLYENGGIYFDTDVEIIKDMHDIVNSGPFFGLSGSKGDEIRVATGLGFGVEKHNPIIKELLDSYENWKGNFFFDERNFPIVSGCVDFNLSIFRKFGVKNLNELQTINGIKFYPTEYFEPLHYSDRVLRITSNTKTIHWYNDKNDYVGVDGFIYSYYAKLNKKHGRKLTNREFNLRLRFFHPIIALKYHNSHKKK